MHGLDSLCGPIMCLLQESMKEKTEKGFGLCIVGPQRMHDTCFCMMHLVMYFAPLLPDCHTQLYKYENFYL
jgi:hypothetical protein